MKRSELYEKKWQIFLRRVRLFRFVPFTDFVLAAGSLATHNLHKNSDFDVIVGVKHGRIFTARFFAVVIFGIPGWRRKKMTHSEAVSDKICLSHFVTPQCYKLRPPYNKYWQNLYHNLVPILGEQEKINKFFASNDWLNPKRTYDIRNFKSNLFHLCVKDFSIKSFIEKMLGGKLGDYLEKWLKNFQVKRIEQSLAVIPCYKPRIFYNDGELEFHPINYIRYTKKIDEIVKSTGKSQKSLDP